MINDNEWILFHFSVCLDVQKTIEQRKFTFSFSFSLYQLPCPENGPGGTIVWGLLAKTVFLLLLLTVLLIALKHGTKQTVPVLCKSPCVH